MIEKNAPPKTVVVSYVLFEVTATGELKQLESSENNFLSDGNAEDWIAERGGKNKKYIIQRCVQKLEE